MGQKEVKSRIASVKKIQKITRAMEMVAAARLRRAEQRIEALRPYASAIRRMTRQAAEAAGNVPNLPILNEHESVSNVGLLLVTGDRGLAGAFNSQIVRAGVRVAAEHEGEGRSMVWYASGRRGVSALTFRGREGGGSHPGGTERPAWAGAGGGGPLDGLVRVRPARRVVADVPWPRGGRLLHGVHRSPGVRRRARHRAGPHDRVRPRRGRPGRDHLQRLHLAAHAGGHARDAAAAAAGDDPRSRG